MDNNLYETIKKKASKYIYSQLSPQDKEDIYSFIIEQILSGKRKVTDCYRFMVIDAVRHLKINTAMIEYQFDEEKDQVLQRYATKEWPNREEVIQKLARLPMNQKVVVMASMLGMPTGDLARVLGVGEARVSQLRTIIKEQRRSYRRKDKKLPEIVDIETLKILNDEDRFIFIAHLYGLKIKSIASITGIGEVSVGNRIRSIRNGTNEKKEERRKRKRVTIASLKKKNEELESKLSEKQLSILSKDMISNQFTVSFDFNRLGRPDSLRYIKMMLVKKVLSYGIGTKVKKEISQVLGISERCVRNWLKE